MGRSAKCKDHIFGVEVGLPWIATAPTEGAAFKDWLETHGPMPLDQFVPFFERIA